MSAGLAADVDAVRRFNRFYTRIVGALDEAYLDSGLSLTQMRVLYELAHRAPVAAQDLSADLGIDPGYMSRILARFETQGWTHRRRDEADGRRSLVTLSDDGRRAFAPFEARSAQRVEALLSPLSEIDRTAVRTAMGTIERVLGCEPGGADEVVFRDPGPGDLGFVVHRHGVIYAEDYGFDATFEALVARIVAEFVERFDPTAERAFIADLGGEVVGSAFLVRKSGEVAKLRLVYVERRARGRGIGRRLVDAAAEAARGFGYRAIELWTNDILLEARALYVSAGYRLIASEPHRSFGRDLVGETWRLDL